MALELVLLFDKPFEVHTNAYEKEIGGVLVQERHPTTFDGSKLHAAELKYSIFEKEMLVVVHCHGVWRHCLLGTE